MIKSETTNCAQHVARAEERRDVCRVFVGKPEGENLEDLGINGMIILI